MGSPSLTLPFIGDDSEIGPPVGMGVQPKRAEQRHYRASACHLKGTLLLVSSAAPECHKAGRTAVAGMAITPDSRNGYVRDRRPAFFSKGDDNGTSNSDPMKGRTRV
jgi:hypothetical protein